MKAIIKPSLFLALSVLSGLGQNIPPTLPRIEPNLASNGPGIKFAI
jgi:hypothetical protein